jgi:DNA-binding NtrC family response regulator
MRDLVDAVEHLAPYRCPVLIFGESGSGKKSLAKVLHTLGPHSDGPLINLYCGALTCANAPLGLFGSIDHSRSAAILPGSFQMAEGGSLLLDEIGELPFALQGRLLHTVENPELHPAGSCETFHFGVRVIASTSRDLAAMVKGGGFRADLYYRLAAASLTVPPLREREADLEPLIADVISSYNRMLGKRVDAISGAALDLLRTHQWPGNLRELSHALERAILLCDKDRISLDDLPSTVGANDYLSDAQGQPAFRRASEAQPPEPLRSFAISPFSRRNSGSAVSSENSDFQPLAGEPDFSSLSLTREDRVRLRTHEAESHCAGRIGDLSLGGGSSNLNHSHKTTARGSRLESNGLLDRAMKDAIERSLRIADGDCAKAAAVLGVSRATLYHKIVSYGLMLRR